MRGQVWGARRLGAALVACTSPAAPPHPLIAIGTFWGGGWPVHDRGGPPPAVQVVWTCERGACVGREGVVGRPRGTPRSVDAAFGGGTAWWRDFARGGGGGDATAPSVARRLARLERRPGLARRATRRVPSFLLAHPRPSPVPFFPPPRCLPCPRDARLPRVLRCPGGVPAWRRARPARGLPSFPSSPSFCSRPLRVRLSTCSLLCAHTRTVGAPRKLRR